MIILDDDVLPKFPRVKLAYSRYNVDIEAKRHLHKKEEETKKRRVPKLHKKKDDEERNTLISLTQQVSLFSKTF